jgi:oligopeptide transport system substrate-binding protein
MDVTQVFRLSWVGDYNDAQTFLKLFDSSSASNLTAFSSAKVDALLAAAAIEIDLGERRVLLEEAERVALAEYPVIPLYFHVSKHLLRSDIQGWESNILDYHYSKHLSRSPD